MEIGGASRIQNLRDDIVRLLESSREEISKSTQKVSSSIKDTLEDLVDAGKRAAATQKVLKSLKYDHMAARHTNIEEAHERTFDWIFQDASEGLPEKPNFLEWLSTRNGIYWIAGKAGSGKSTLIKYLYKHPGTGKALQKWAGSKKVVTAGHFFWIAGSQMQKSQDGLLRSLLDNILTKCPELIPTITPSRWKSYISGTEYHDPWTRTELLQAFGCLKQQDEIPVKYCFFVDGLDEYGGDHAEIVTVLEDFTKSVDIKVCISSRPWNIFEKSFGTNGDAKLYLEDLTRNDIRLYVQDNLGKDHRFITLEEDTVKTFLKKDLVVEIVDLAHGVFLWVVLVVRDLLRGLSNDDTVRILRKRLYLLPPTLEDYFMSMLNSIDKVYREQTAQIMFMALASDHPLPLLTLSFLDESDPRYAIKAAKKPRSKEELINICRKTRFRVKARCSDLMEITKIEDYDSTQPEVDDAIQSEIDLFFQPEVVFLHRTVRDFLLTREIQEYLRRQLHTAFDPNIYLSSALLAQIKMLSLCHFKCDGIVPQMTASFMEYCQLVEKTHGSLDLALLDEAERVLSFHWSQMCPDFEIMSYGLDFGSVDACIFQCSIQGGLHRYVKKRLREEPALAKGPRHCPLQAALFTPTMPHNFVQRSEIDFEMVQLLLSSGASPNQYIIRRGETLWCSFLKAFPETEKDPKTVTWLKVVEMLLRAGANPGALIIASSEPLRKKHDALSRPEEFPKRLAPFDIISQFCSENELRILRNIARNKRRKEAANISSPWNWACSCFTRRRRKGSTACEEVTPLLHSREANS